MLPDSTLFVILSNVFCYVSLLYNRRKNDLSGGRQTLSPNYYQHGDGCKEEHQHTIKTCRPLVILDCTYAKRNRIHKLPNNQLHFTYSALIVAVMDPE